MYRRGYSGEEQLYRRVPHGKAVRYEPVVPFEGWPSEGIWIVQESRDAHGRRYGVRSSKFANLAELTVPDRLRDLAALEATRDSCQRAVLALQRTHTDGSTSVTTYPSIHDTITAIFDALAGKTFYQELRALHQRDPRFHDNFRRVGIRRCLACDVDIEES